MGDKNNIILTQAEQLRGALSQFIANELTIYVDERITEYIAEEMEFLIKQFLEEQKQQFIDDIKVRIQELFESELLTKKERKTRLK